MTSLTIFIDGSQYASARELHLALKKCIRVIEDLDGEVKHI